MNILTLAAVAAIAVGGFAGAGNDDYPDGAGLLFLVLGALMLFTHVADKGKRR